MGSIIGHGAIMRELRGLAANVEPPHALLFAGPEGTGRRLLAAEYARLLNCERLHPAPGAPASLLAPDPALPTGDGACGACRACRLIDEGRHPDMIALGPGDTLCRPRPGESQHEKHPQSREIRICQVRGLIDLVARFPFEARYRLIAIDPADRLGREAAHTILKTLEEPPGHTVFALVTAAPEALLETIRSRCRRIAVPIVPRATIRAGLVARGVVDGVAEQAAEAARGRPGAALAFAAEPSLIGDRARLHERCAQIAGAGLTERFAYAGKLAERYRADRSSVGPELRAWEAYWEEALREIASAGSGESRGAGLSEVVGALRAITQLRDDLQANVMSRAAIELMLLRFPRRRLAEVAQEESMSHV